MHTVAGANGGGDVIIVHVIVIVTVILFASIKNNGANEEVLEATSGIMQSYNFQPAVSDPQGCGRQRELGSQLEGTIL